MKLNVTVFALLACGLVQTSCSRDKVLSMMNFSGSSPEGKVITKTYDFHGISSVDVSAGIYVYYTQAPEALPVKVVGPEDVLAVLSIKCDSDGELELGFDGRKRFNFTKESDHVKVYITAPDVHSFDLSSGSVVSGEAPVVTYSDFSVEASSGAYAEFVSVKSPKVEIDASSGADVEITSVYADALSAEVSSGAFVKVAGQSDVVELKASSGGTLNASALKADHGEARASSGGSVKSAIKRADINKSSGGSVSNKM